MTHEEIVQRVAWALHCWTCPLCTNLTDMAHSDQDHVLQEHIYQAEFLAGALGLTDKAPE